MENFFFGLTTKHVVYFGFELNIINICILNLSFM